MRGFPIWAGALAVALLVPSQAKALDNQAWALALAAYKNSGGDSSAKATAQLRLSAQMLSETSTEARSLDVNVVPSTQTLIIDEDPDYRRNYELLVSDYLKEASNNNPNDDTRIIGGQPTSNYRDTVAISRAPGQPSGLCSGVLLDTNVVLTAGHCSCANISDHVTFGQTSGSYEGAGGAFFQVDDARTKRAFTVCPADGAVVRGHDLALFFLDEIVANSVAEPRRVADLSLLESDNTYKVRAVGFGLDENGTKGIKRHVDIAIVSKFCNRATRHDDQKYGCVPGKELVAQSPDFTTDTCSGDSGGPIYIYGRDKYYLVGITSRAIRGGKCHDGGIYTLITPEVIEWMRSNGVNVRRPS